MSKAILSLNLANNSALDDPYWLNMEIKKAALADGLTVVAAAAVIDAAYNIKACEEQNSEDIWQRGPDTNRDIWTDVADNTGVDAGTVLAQKRFVDALDVGGFTEDCKYGLSSIAELVSYRVTIKVFRSHHDELYKLQMANGTAGPATMMRGRVIKTVNVKNQTHITLDNPIVHHRPVQAPVVAWQGANGGKINIKGNTLYWDLPFTGTLRAEFDTEWDEVTITVTGDPADRQMISGSGQAWFGTGWYSGTETGDEIDDYQNVQCSVLAFYHYQYEELTLSKPEKDESTTETDQLNICHFVVKTVDGEASDPGEADPNAKCKQHINETVICQCDGEEKSNNHYEMVPCPAGVANGATLRGSVGRTTYKDCGYRDKANDPAYYEDQCCPLPDDYAGGGLPLCMEVVTRFSGAGQKDLNQTNYPHGTEFITVSPANGQCGEHTVKQEVKSNNCCVGVPALDWDEDFSAEIIGQNSSATVCVTGGKMPITWKVRGNGMYANAAKSKSTIVTNNRVFTIYSDVDACGGGSVAASDGCSVAYGSLRASEGQWVRNIERDNYCPGAGGYYSYGQVVYESGADRWYQRYGKTTPSGGGLVDGCSGLYEHLTEVAWNGVKNSVKAECLYPAEYSRNAIYSALWDARFECEAVGIGFSGLLEVVYPAESFMVNGYLSTVAYKWVCE